MKHNRRTTRLEMVLTILGLIGMVVLAVVYGHKDFSDLISSLSWQQADGEVISAEIRTQKRNDGEDSYQAYVTYFYYIGDEKMTNDRVRFGDSIYSDNKGAAEKTIAKYAPQTRVKVLYNPNDPSDAVLERTVTSGFVALTIAGLLGVSFLTYAAIQTARGKSLR